MAGVGQLGVGDDPDRRAAENGDLLADH
jgi:hypothetical protein